MGPEGDEVAGVCGGGAENEEYDYGGLDYRLAVGRLVLASRVLGDTNCVRGMARSMASEETRAVNNASQDSQVVQTEVIRNY